MEQVQDFSEGVSGAIADDLSENAIIGTDPSIIPIDTPFSSSGNDDIFGTYLKERILGNGGNDDNFFRV